MGEHVKGEPYHFSHGWVPVGGADKTSGGKGKALMDRITQEIAPEGPSYYHMPLARDRKALAAQAPNENVKKTILNRADGHGVAVVRDSDGTIRGAASYSPDSQGKTMAIGHLWVDKNGRGSGTGRKVVQAIAQHAQEKSKGKNDWSIGVTNALDTAIPFYASTGATFREGSHVGHWSSSATNAAASGEHVDNRSALTQKQIEMSSGKNSLAVPSD